MCIKTISNFKRKKKRFLKKQTKKVCDVTCEFYSQGYRFSIRLWGIGLRLLTCVGFYRFKSNFYDEMNKVWTQLKCQF